MPDFVLPADHPAREAGIDLSKPQTIGDTNHPALPGMTPGYFSGDAPNIGATQD